MVQFIIFETICIVNTPRHQLDRRTLPGRSLLRTASTGPEHRVLDPQQNERPVRSRRRCCCRCCRLLRRSWCRGVASTRETVDGDTSPSPRVLFRVLRGARLEPEVELPNEAACVGAYESEDKQWRGADQCTTGIPKAKVRASKKGWRREKNITAVSPHAKKQSTSPP